MLTDRTSRKPTLRAGSIDSDGNRIFSPPQDNRLKVAAKAIEASLELGTTSAARQACAEFLNTLADFYKVETPSIRVLAARPLRSREGRWATELFGDYDPKTKLIRVWMRTAVRKQVTSFGTFLSTLCHDFCHHLDYERFKYGD